MSGRVRGRKDKNRRRRMGRPRPRKARKSKKTKLDRRRSSADEEEGMAVKVPEVVAHMQSKRTEKKKKAKWSGRSNSQLQATRLFAV